jgi:hypothetical protein
MGMLPGTVAPADPVPLTETPTRTGAWWSGIAATPSPRGKVCATAHRRRSVCSPAPRPGQCGAMTAGLMDHVRQPRLLAAQADGHRIALDEAVVERCRPERQLDLVGCDDQILLHSTGRHGRAATAGVRPTIAVTGTRAGEGRLHVDVTASSAGSASALAGIDVWVDGVPLRGAPTAGTTATAGFEIDLPPWPATIEMALRDAAGTASWRERVAVQPGANGRDPPAGPDGHALVRGASQIP